MRVLQEISRIVWLVSEWLKKYIEICQKVRWRRETIEKYNLSKAGDRTPLSETGSQMPLRDTIEKLGWAARYARTTAEKPGWECISYELQMLSKARARNPK